MPPTNSKKNIKIIPIKEIIEQEPNEDVVIDQEPKEEIIVEEPKEEIIVEDIKNEEPKEDIVIEEPKENIIIEEPKSKSRKDRMAERVICPDCNKTLTKKTFDYNHKFTCKTVKAQKKADEIKTKQKEKNEQEQLKKQKEEKYLREKIEKEIEEKYNKMNNQLSVEVPVVEKINIPPPPPAPKLSNMDIRRLNHMNRYSKLKLQII